MLGGSSSINAMVYIRGNHRDYDEWGVPGWSWDDLFPYFLKAEDNERGESEWHAVGGPLPVSEQRSGMPLSPAWVDAGVEAGLARNDDFNGAEQDGVGTYQVTQREGMRGSAAVAYLHPAMAERPNLTVMPFMHVNRVLFEGTRAVGVEATQLGEAKELRAEREVILCGGTFNSPQLLMLSGVGPAEHLEMREVETLLDQPAVGQNLSDHACAYGVWTSTEATSLLDAMEPAALEQFEASKTGVFTSNFAESGGFARVGAGAEAPDVQFHTVPLQIVDEGFSDPEAHGVWASVCLLTPESRGSVTLASNDPTAQPVIRNSFYSEGSDLERMVAGTAADPGDLRAAGPGGLLLAALHGPGRRLRRGARRARRPHDVPDLPPGRHLRDRLGARCRAAGRGAGGRAGRRLLGDADRAARQHQRAGDRAGRACRRPDQGRDADARRAPSRRRRPRGRVARRLLCLSARGGLQRLHGAAAPEPRDRPPDLGRRHRAPTTRAWPRSARCRTAGRSSTAPAAPARRCAPCGRTPASATSPPTSRRRCCGGRANEPRSAGSSGIELVESRAEDLPLEAGSADLFLSYWGLHCFPDPRRRSPRSAAS